MTPQDLPGAGPERPTTASGPVSARRAPGAGQPTTGAVEAVEGCEGCGWAYRLTHLSGATTQSPFHYRSAVEALGAGARQLPYWVDVVEGREPF